MIEREIKYLISKCDYEVAVQNKSVVTQTNYYFAQDNRIIDNTLRIRKNNNKYTLTLKVKKDVTADEYVSIEYNAIITDKKAKRYMREGIQAELLKELFDVDICGDKFVYIGSLVTERAKISIPFDLILELDKNSYLDFVDYEIECECATDEQVLFAKQYIKENYSTSISLPKIIRYLNRYNLNK